jgi:hypothetical protein
MATLDSTLERFWSKVRVSDGCWLWTSAVVSGYGQFGMWKGRNVYAHRFSWELAHRMPVPDGMCVCHHCDNKLCVNPDHLFVGTYADNTADMMRKGRHYRQKNPLVVCKNGHPASERKHGKGCYRCQLDRGARLRRLERERRRVERYAGL